MQMVSFVAHKETIDLAMQNGINLVASLLCDNDLIKRAVSARIKFYRKRRKIIHKILRFLCRFKICNTKFQIKIYGKISRRGCNLMSESEALRTNA